MHHISPIWQIRIGMDTNQETSIYETYGGEASVTVITPDILHCNVTRTFWITWTSDSIAVGQGGNFYEGRITEHKPMSRVNIVQAMGIGSSHLSELDYEFINIQGRLN